MTDTEYQQLVEFLGRRFTEIDQRFVSLEQRFDARFDTIEQQLQEIRSKGR